MELVTGYLKAMEAAMGCWVSEGDAVLAPVALWWWQLAGEVATFSGIKLHQAEHAVGGIS